MRRSRSYQARTSSPKVPRSTPVRPRPKTRHQSLVGITARSTRPSRPRIDSYPTRLRGGLLTVRYRVRYTHKRTNALGPPRRLRSRASISASSERARRDRSGTPAYRLHEFHHVVRHRESAQLCRASVRLINVCAEPILGLCDEWLESEARQSERSAASVSHDCSLSIWSY